MRRGVAVATAGMAVICGLVVAAGLPSAGTAPRGETLSGTVTLAPGSIIAAEGDSLTYGMDVSPAGTGAPINGASFSRSRTPFPEALAGLVPRCPVINEGFPGDRSIDGLVRWQNAPRRSLTLMMFGSNDALNNGNASSGPLSVATFKAVYELMIERRRSQDGTVLVLLPPPIGDPATDRRIQPFRDEQRVIARQRGLIVFDTPKELEGVRQVWTPDKVHLSEEANRRIAFGLAKLIRC